MSMIRRVTTVLAAVFLAACSTAGEADDRLRFLALGDSYTVGEGVAADEHWPPNSRRRCAPRG